LALAGVLAGTGGLAALASALALAGVRTHAVAVSAWALVEMVMPARNRVAAAAAMAAPDLEVTFMIIPPNGV